LLSALLALGAGLILMEWRIEGSAFLAELLLVFFVIEGIATILFAIEHKRRLTGRCQWLLASGVVDLVLAIFVFNTLPEGRDWAIAALIGINLTFGGFALIAVAIGEHVSHSRPDFKT
jgi:uncharacterized membrane protein HdeD (DUF308 family)